MAFYFTWEDVGIISLSRSEDTAIAQRHLPKRTSTGKETSALWTQSFRVIDGCQEMKETAISKKIHEKCIWQEEALSTSVRA